MQKKAGPAVIAIAAVALVVFLVFTYKRAMVKPQRGPNYVGAWEKIRQPNNMAKVKELLRTKYGQGGAAPAGAPAPQ